jgi:hypothetical protein
MWNLKVIVVTGSPDLIETLMLLPCPMPFPTLLVLSKTRLVEAVFCINPPLNLPKRTYTTI